ncbi:MAG: 30S ribosomal protein S17 [Cuniculiplasma sp.]
MTRNIGLDIAPPEKECEDKKCPYHSNLSVRGRVTIGTVVSKGMVNSVVVRREFKTFNSKYERNIKSVSSYHVHLPPCIDVKNGDRVLFTECRKLSKTISHVVVGRLDQ